MAKKGERWRRARYAVSNIINVGWVKQCARCKDWWPADYEFYRPDDACSGGIGVYCRACCIELTLSSRQKVSVDDR